MIRGSEDGFSMLELMVATGALLAVLAGALYFFSNSQTIYSNERVTLDMVQDTRLAFDRLTNEIRMAAAGLPGNRGIISGRGDELIVRGDFTGISTIVNSLGLNEGGVFDVGTTEGFRAGQTISLLNINSGAAGLVKVASINKENNRIVVDTSSFEPITSGAQINFQSNPLTGFPSGTIINVVERRTYRIITRDDDPSGPKGAITRKVSYEDTNVAGNGQVVQPEEPIALNVLKENGDVGLRFSYYDANDSSVSPDPDTGLVDPIAVYKVKVDLDSRTAERDIRSGRYRTMHLTAFVQVRGQYIPKIGF